MKTKRIKVLTTDDGQQFTPQYRKTSDFGFWFSSNLEDWYKGKNSKKRQERHERR